MNFNAPRDDIDPDMGHWVGEVKCRACGHEAVHVVPVPLSDPWPPPLECSECGEMKMYPTAERMKGGDD